jgi:dynein heavy chain, axonemal
MQVGALKMPNTHLIVCLTQQQHYYAISPSAPLALLNLCTAGVAVENSTQYKTVLDALRARKDRFAFEDVEIALRPSVMAFITMNPGYPGRAGASTQTHAL